jgi:hypothetical protein
MIFKANIEEDFFQQINTVLKQFCNKYDKFGYIYEELSKEEIFERLNKSKTIFISAYYSFLEPAFNLHASEIINIAHLLYKRKELKINLIVSSSNNFKWYLFNDILEIFDILGHMNIRMKNFDDFYQYFLNNNIYFLIGDNKIFIGISHSKHKNKNGKKNIETLTKNDETLLINFKEHTDKLFEKINVSINLPFIELNQNKKIKTFNNGTYWSYITDPKQIKQIGKTQNNELQHDDFIQEYNNIMELYFLFNEENQPLMLASFNRENSKPDVISSGNDEKINKVFKPYVDYILKYKKQNDFFIPYDNDIDNLH